MSIHVGCICNVLDIDSETVDKLRPDSVGKRTPNLQVYFHNGEVELFRPHSFAIKFPKSEAARLIALLTEAINDKRNSPSR